MIIKWCATDYYVILSIRFSSRRTPLGAGIAQWIAQTQLWRDFRTRWCGKGCFSQTTGSADSYAGVPVCINIKLYALLKIPTTGSPSYHCLNTRNCYTHWEEWRQRCSCGCCSLIRVNEATWISHEGKSVRIFFFFNAQSTSAVISGRFPRGTTNHSKYFVTSYTYT